MEGVMFILLAFNKSSVLVILAGRRSVNTLALMSLCEELRFHQKGLLESFLAIFLLQIRNSQGCLYSSWLMIDGMNSLNVMLCDFSLRSKSLSPVHLGKC